MLQEAGSSRPEAYLVASALLHENAPASRGKLGLETLCLQDFVLAAQQAGSDTLPQSVDSRAHKGGKITARMNLKMSLHVSAMASGLRVRRASG